MQKVEEVVVRPRTRSDVEEEWIGQEIFIHDRLNGQEVHCLNSGAALIWLLCDGARDIEGMAEELAVAFGTSRQTTLRDVGEIVAQLEGLGLLENNRKNRISEGE